MENRYDGQVREFFDDLADFLIEADAKKVIRDMLSNWFEIHDNRDADVLPVSLRASWFDNGMNKKTDKKDYGAYYATKVAYDAIIRYYRSNAKYNLKDAELESALKNWRAIIYPKQNIFSRLIDGIRNR